VTALELLARARCLAAQLFDASLARLASQRRPFRAARHAQRRALLHEHVVSVLCHALLQEAEVRAGFD
jgi:hypothetical protein